MRTPRAALTGRWLTRLVLCCFRAELARPMPLALTIKVHPQAAMHPSGDRLAHIDSHLHPFIGPPGRLAPRFALLSELQLSPNSTC